MIELCDGLAVPPVDCSTYETPPIATSKSTPTREVAKSRLSAPLKVPGVSEPSLITGLVAPSSVYCALPVVGRLVKGVPASVTTPWFALSATAVVPFGVPVGVPLAQRVQAMTEVDVFAVPKSIACAVPRLALSVPAA